MSVEVATDYTSVIIDGKKKGDEEEGIDTEKSLADRLQSDPITTCSELIKMCEKAMQPRVEAWQRYRRKYRRGLKYLGQDLNQNPLYSTNYVFNVVEGLKSYLTQNLPSITLFPEETSDAWASSTFSKLLSKSLKGAGLKTKLYNVVHHGAITGTGWFKIWFDQNLDKGKGNIALDSYAPEDIMIPPYCLDYKTSNVFIHRLRDMTIDDIKANYEVDSVDSGERKDDNDRSLGDTTRKNSFIKTYDVYEVWVSEYTPEGIKWWIAAITGKTLLQKPKESPYKHGRAPFIPWYDVYDIGADQAYVVGVGEVEEIEALQDLSDALDMRIYRNIKQITARQKILNPASGINKEDVDDTPNRVYLCAGRPAESMVWDTPPALSADVYMYRERIESRIQTVSGMYDVAQGKKPGGIEAFKAINALQQAAQSRMEKRKETLCDLTLVDLASLATEIILQYFTDERIVRLEGGDTVKIVGDYPENLKSIKPIDPLTGEQMDLPEDMSDEEKAALESDLEIQKAQYKIDNGINLVLSDINFKYDLNVSVDSALPADRGARAQLYFDLFRIGCLDRKALLDGLDFPDREEILKRLEANVTGKTPPELNPDNNAMLQQKQAMEMAMQQQNNMPQNIGQLF